MSTRSLTVVAVLGIAAAASAQVTYLGGGAAPLVVGGSPQPGQTMTFSSLPAPLPFVVVGLTRVDTPLAPFGPGCPDVVVPDLDLVSSVWFSLSIPNTPSVTGFTFYAQGVLAGMGICHIGFPIQMTQAVRVVIQ